MTTFSFKSAAIAAIFSMWLSSHASQEANPPSFRKDGHFVGFCSYKWLEARNTLLILVPKSIDVINKSDFVVPSQESVNLSLEAVFVCKSGDNFIPQLKVSLDRSSRQYTSLIHEFFTSCCRYNDVNFFFAAHQAFLDKASKRLLKFLL